MTALARDPGRRPRVLIVAAYFPPMGGGGVVRMAKLTKYLAELGWDVTVIADDEPLTGLHDERLVDEVPAGVAVHYVTGPFRFLGRPAESFAANSKLKGRGGRVIGFLKAAVRSVLIPDRFIGWAWTVARSSRDLAGSPDVILSSGPPHSAHLAAARLSRRFGVPFVMDLRDDWADNPLHSSRAPWRRPLDLLIERWCLRRAAHVVLVSEPSRRGYVDANHHLDGRATVITNGFDPDDVRNAATVRPADTGAIHFLHAGSLRRVSRDARPFLNAFGRVAAATDQPIVLDLLGEISPEHEAFAEMTIPPDRLRIERFVEHDQALIRMASADVLVIITTAAEAGAAGTMTGKIFECLAVRRPILLVAPPGPATELIRSSGAGVIATPDNPAGIEEAIARVAEMARDPEFCGAPDQLIDRFDRRSLARRFSEILEEAGGVTR